MTIRLNAYIHFRDNARHAMEFYHSVLGGKVTYSTFGQYQMAQDSSENDKIMHSELIADNGFALMASDTPNSMEFKPGTNITLSLSGSDEAELRGLWNKLLDGATVAMPLEKAPWGDSFGQLTDKFGISWLVNISSGEQSH